MVCNNLVDIQSYHVDKVCNQHEHKWYCIYNMVRNLVDLAHYLDKVYNGNRDMFQFDMLNIGVVVYVWLWEVAYLYTRVDKTNEPHQKQISVHIGRMAQFLDQND